ncbi:MAG TPA: nuclear transport factor 2 family protein [Gemmatimonadales bacterium]|jgi:ketosteroid isomerase-like protein|nr:nuclear transport factor 2 family protein [Gemmatimonadales bacterium]
MRPTHSLIAIFAVLSSSACRPRAETPEAAMARQAADQKAAEEAIATAQERFVLHYNSGHADSLAAFYAPDAHLMPANLPAVVGTAAIQAAFTQAVASKGQLKLVTESVSASGDLAVERGTYEETYTPAGSSTPVTDRGKYLAHWQRMGGKWVMVNDIANSDLPTTATSVPAPAASRP